MIKIILTIITINLSLFSFDSSSYENMLIKPIQQDNLKKVKSEFGEIAKYKNAEADKFLKEFVKKMKINAKSISYNQASVYFEENFKGNEFLTKNEARYLLKLVYKMKEEAFTDSHLFLLYFSTREIPRNQIANILLGVKALQDNGLNINTKQYFTGVPDDIQKYIMGWKDYMLGFPIKYQAGLSRNFRMKFDPRFFNVYKIKEAPAMAIAFCQSAIPEPKKCKLKYLIRGDVPLLQFFEEISLIEPKYKKYVKILEANGIYLPKNEVNKNVNQKK